MLERFTGNSMWHYNPSLASKRLDEPIAPSRWMSMQRNMACAPATVVSTFVCTWTASGGVTFHVFKRSSDFAAASDLLAETCNLPTIASLHASIAALAVAPDWQVMVATLVAQKTSLIQPSGQLAPAFRGHCGTNKSLWLVAGATYGLHLS
jgi:hypothetical protein